jgi:hypothetical protein
MGEPWETKIEGSGVFMRPLKHPLPTASF